MSKRIRLTQGKVAIVDDADFERLNQWKWYALKHKNTWYAARTMYLGGGQKHRKQRQIYMHHEIFKLPTDTETDHKDGNGWNNQRHNLRMATRAQNQQNRRKRPECSSQFKGVCWHRDRAKWQAQIRVDGKRLHLGYFNSELEAARTYDRAAIKYFGEFAHLNFR